HSEPFALDKVAHDPLAVDDLQEISPSGPEHVRRGLDHQPIIRLIEEIAKAGEEIEDQVKLLAGNRPAHVALQPANLDAAGLRPGLRHADEIWRQVHPRHLIAAPRQLDGMPALAARQIQDAQRRSQLAQGLELIDLERGALALRVVVQRKVAWHAPGPPPVRSRWPSTL